MNKDKHIIFFSRLIGFTLLVTMIFISIAHAAQKDVINGPIKAHVLKVIDGDTLFVEAHIWLDQSVKTFIRINGIDTAEKKAKCAYEKKMANKATDFVKKHVDQKEVFLHNIHYGKYAGRVVADVYTSDNEKLSDLLYSQDLARHYTGGKRASWC